MNNILNVSPSPHQQSPETTRKLMYGVVIALLPALAASIYYFGMGAIIVTLTSVLSCVAVEYPDTKIYSKGQTLGNRWFSSGYRTAACIQCAVQSAVFI